MCRVREEGESLPGQGGVRRRKKVVLVLRLVENDGAASVLTCVWWCCVQGLEVWRDGAEGGEEDGADLGEMGCSEREW